MGRALERRDLALSRHRAEHQRVAHTEPGQERGARVDAQLAPVGQILQGQHAQDALAERRERTREGVVVTESQRARGHGVRHGVGAGEQLRQLGRIALVGGGRCGAA